MLLSQSGCERIEISQTYLISGDGVSARVRKSVCGGKCTYTRTEKTHITDMSRTETENEITEDEYRQALLSAAPGLRTVEKVRYRHTRRGACVGDRRFPVLENAGVS